mmetsp:Transcript_3471/g.5028  ORF Transcript_3471/g.5028 Transcript_3471/m.5028 type:complete len:202 (+) Transcript_3471:297-902(+)
MAREPSWRCQRTTSETTSLPKSLAFLSRKLCQAAMMYKRCPSQVRARWSTPPTAFSTSMVSWWMRQRLRPSHSSRPRGMARERSITNCVTGSFHGSATGVSRSPYHSWRTARSCPPPWTSCLSRCPRLISLSRRAPLKDPCPPLRTGSTTTRPSAAHGARLTPCRSGLALAGITCDSSTRRTPARPLIPRSRNTGCLSICM